MIDDWTVAEDMPWLSVPQHPLYCVSVLSPGSINVTKWPARYIIPITLSILGTSITVITVITIITGQ